MEEPVGEKNGGEGKDKGGEGTRRLCERACEREGGKGGVCVRACKVCVCAFKEIISDSALRFA